MKTLKECKDEVAKSLGYKDWQQHEDAFIDKDDSSIVVLSNLEQAVNIFTSQFKESEGTLNNDDSKEDSHSKPFLNSITRDLDTFIPMMLDGKIGEHTEHSEMRLGYTNVCQGKRITLALKIRVD